MLATFPTRSTDARYMDPVDASEMTQVDSRKLTGI